MKILTAEQVRQWDRYTIEHEPISSIDLMEKAAVACVLWIENNMGGSRKQFSVFCGKGNNGGDGLAIARMLSLNNHDVSVFILEFGHKGTDDFQTNLAKLHRLPKIEIRFIQDVTHFPELLTGQTIIDALFGTGLNRFLEGVTEKLVMHINGSGHPVIAIDLPSGLLSDQSTRPHTAIRATHTLSFQCYKPALLFAENEIYTGKVHILDIGLSASFDPGEKFQWIDHSLAAALYRPRNDFAHKGNFGHAFLLAGSHGKMGAAILAARACLAAGPGLLTTCIPSSGYETMQAAVPEAMAETAGSDFLEGSVVVSGKYRSTGIGPGIGTHSSTAVLLKNILQQSATPLVLDADALNIIGADPSLKKFIPPFSILTPHPKEFERLFGASDNDFDRAEKAALQAKELSSIIILKGHHTLVSMPGGQQYFNSTGNPGMAKGGSGDVLTGFITGLIASGYTPNAAAILGVYLHGLAGDMAAASGSMETMIASDLILHLPAAFRTLYADTTTTDTGF
jgi:ADP-dependent NAD(P)H-hydrate dehydratase / NAD(P)H-hydrate epimerase